MHHVLAVDGNSLGHRAWHAMKHEQREGPWVTHAFVRMLGSAWAYGPFDAVIVAFDSRESIRKERCAAYKANRDSHDPELYAQFDLLADILDECGFVTVQEDGCEADDLLAAAARAARDEGVACSVLSSDRDLLALVRDSVTLLRPRATMAEITVYDPDAVEDEFGVTPQQYRHLAALRGDPSDGLDGVHGVGAKTAARLISQWGSIDDLYEDVRHLPPPLARQLRDDHDKVLRNLDLMRPIETCDIDVVGALAAGIDSDRVVDVLQGHELYAAAGAFRAAYERGPLPPPPPPPDETIDYGRFAANERELHEPVVVTGEQVSLFD